MSEPDATAHEPLVTRVTLRRFAVAIRSFVTSEVRGQAAALFATLLVVLMLAINGMNVVNSYVGRDFMTAIEQRDKRELRGQAFRYVGVFAVSTMLAVLFRFCEERLGLLWRQWLTRALVHDYLGLGTPYRACARPGRSPTPISGSPTTCALSPPRRSPSC